MYICLLYYALDIIYGDLIKKIKEKKNTETFQIKKTDLRIHVFVIFTYAGANNDFKNKKKISISPYSSFYFLFLMAGVCSCVLSGVCMRACVCVNVLLFQPIYPFSSSSSSSSSINFLL